MSSVAILPPLKRTLTDLMDEEFYQAPSSPGSVRAESPGPTPGSPQQNLSSLLNIPDSFLEQYTRMVKPNATTSQVNLVGGVSNININSPYTSNPASFSEFGLVNPFTDYADPDSLTNQRFVQPQQLSRFPTRLMTWSLLLAPHLRHYSKPQINHHTFHLQIILTTSLLAKRRIANLVQWMLVTLAH